MENSVILAGGVVQSPVLTDFTGEGWALDAAAHGDDHIDGRQVFQAFRVLVCHHVDAVAGFHEPDGIGIDLVLDGGARGPGCKDIRRQAFAQGFSHLASAGIVGADKGDVG